MEIVKFNKQLAPTLSKVEIDAVKAGIQPKIKDMKVHEFSVHVHSAMSKAYTIKGISSLTDTFKQQLAIVIEKIKSDYQHATIGEICHAIELGSFGTFDEGRELQTISPMNIISWINSYKIMIRSEAQIKQREFEEKQRIEAEKAKHEQKLAEFEAFIENGILNGFGDNIGVKASVYRHLDKKGRINLSKDEKMTIWDMANEYYDSLPKDFDGNITGYLFTLKDVAESKALDYWILNKQ